MALENKENLFSVEGVTSSDRVLHTPGSFAKKNLTYVQETGVLKSFITENRLTLSCTCNVP